VAARARGSDAHKKPVEYCKNQQIIFSSPAGDELLFRWRSCILLQGVPGLSDDGQGIGNVGACLEWRRVEALRCARGAGWRGHAVAVRR
jgi:hypothetical protein